MGKELRERPRVRGPVPDGPGRAAEATRPWTLRPNDAAVHVLATSIERTTPARTIRAVSHGVRETGAGGVGS